MGHFLYFLRYFQILLTENISGVRFYDVEDIRYFTACQKSQICLEQWKTHRNMFMKLKANNIEEV